MSEASYSPERKLSGTSRVVIGFIVGALFALAPMYYFYMGRDAALRGQHSEHAPLFASTAAPLRAARADAAEGGGAVPPFASRMTYELSRLPEEPLTVVARAPLPAAAAAVSSGSRAPAVSAPREEPPLAERVLDARPISTRPPDPRDRTAAIEEEAHKPEYRGAARRERAASAAAPRSYEGREVEVKTPRLPDTPTRPIVAGASTNMRAEIEAERARSAPEPTGAKASAEAQPHSPAGGALAEPRPAVAGVTPITRAPEALPRQTLLAKAKPAAAPPESAKAASAPAGAPVQGGTVKSRLAATREWLAGAPQTTHTIQLMGTHNEEQLDAQLTSLGSVLEPARIYVFRTMAQGKPSITVLYGAYDDRKSALEALGKLPAAIAANRPVLRTVNGIRAEMKQHKTEG